MPKVRMLLLPLLLGTQACVPFAGGTVIAATPSACSTLIPEAWRAGVAGAELPDGNTVGDWIAFGDAQTGRLDVANGRTSDALGIISRCELRDQLSVKKSRAKVLGLF